MLRPADEYEGWDNCRTLRASFARRLWFCRRGSRSLRRRRWSLFEIDLGSLASALVCLEVRVVSRKATQTRYQIIGEQGNIGIVVLQRFVVSPPLHRDSVLFPAQFSLNPQKLFFEFQLRIIFHHNQQAP